MYNKIITLVGLTFFSVASFYSIILGKTLFWFVVMHRPERKVFEKYLRFLNCSSGFFSISEFCSDHGRFGRGVFVNISFDDGWRQNLSLISCFVDYSLKVDVYVCPGLVESGLPPWNFCLADRKQGNRHLNSWLKQVPLPVRQKYLQEISRGENIVEQREMMSWDDLNIIKMYANIYFHGGNHQPCVTLDDDELDDEVNSSCSILEEKLGVPVRFMSLPYGIRDRRVEASNRFVRLRGFNEPLFIASDFNGSVVPAVGLPDTKFSLCFLALIWLKAFGRCILR